jgi:hypothetical protein
MGAQSCWAKDHGLGHVSYTVHIGATYDDWNVDPNAPCIGMSIALEEQVGAWDVACQEDGSSGETLVTFWCHSGNMVGINNVMEQYFPSINGFNCQNY